MNPAPYQFMLRGFAIVSPVLLFMLLSETFLALCGETTSIREVALRHLPSGAAAVYWPMFFGTQERRLHLERILKVRPKVLVLGSSRVERFRREMFAADAEFYNACQSIRSVGSLQAFVESLPRDYAPQAVLIGVDCWWVNGPANGPAQSASPDDLPGDLRRDDTRMLNAHLVAWQSIVESAWHRRIGRSLLRTLLRRADNGIRRYGAHAWTDGGYRNDGSFQPLERRTPKTYRSNLPGTLQAVVRRSRTKRGLVPAARVDPHLLQQLETALKSLAMRGTRIVGFAPPYDSKTLKCFSEHPAEFGVLPDFRRKVPDLFKANGWHFYDGTDPAGLALDDRCMEELYHAGETYHVALLRRLAEDRAVAQALQLDLPYLESLLQDSRTTPAYPYYPQERLERAVGTPHDHAMGVAATVSRGSLVFPRVPRWRQLQPRGEGA